MNKLYSTGIKDMKTAPQNVSLGDLGLDSLMSVEVMQTIERELDIVLSQTEVRDLTLTAIKKLQDSSSTSTTDSNDKGEYFQYFVILFLI